MIVCTIKIICRYKYYKVHHELNTIYFYNDSLYYKNNL